VRTIQRKSNFTFLLNDLQPKFPTKPVSNFKNYNIVTNQYLEHHDSKLVADEQVLRAEAAKKYWKTHNFDVINCQYYDQAKEDEFLKKRQEQAKTHGQDQVKKLPITV
jgi:hypothetical protein